MFLFFIFSLAELNSPVINFQTPTRSASASLLLIIFFFFCSRRRRRSGWGAPVVRRVARYIMPPTLYSTSYIVRESHTRTSTEVETLAYKLQWCWTRRITFLSFFLSYTWTAKSSWPSPKSCWEVLSFFSFVLFVLEESIIFSNARPPCVSLSL